MLNTIREHLNHRELVFVVAFVLCLAFCFYRPQLGQTFFLEIEKWTSRLSRRKSLAILIVGISPIFIRLALLPLIPAPVPQVHDEFSYLLAADTFASGRLTNPAHPMSLFMDTIHVNQHPTYMSKYPPAQGMILAFGQITTGHPWTGVLLSVGLMCGATLWMLQGWLPPDWAFLGGVLVVLRLGIFSYWMNSYWGGAVPAIGGALVLGAVPRLIRSNKPLYSLILGIGAVVLMNSRPLEGFALCLPVAALLLHWLVSKRSPPMAISLWSVVAPCTVVLLMSLVFVGYYNYRNTGSALLMPYVLNERNYWSTPTLLWQKLRPPIHFANPQFESFYNVWSRNLWLETTGSVFKRATSVIMKLVYFFCWPELCVPLSAIVLVVRDRKFRFLFVELIISFAAFLVVAWFQPHYAAPVVTAIFALLVQGIRHLRYFEFRGRSTGMGLTRVIIIFSFLLSPFHPHSAAFEEPSKANDRATIQSQLEAMPGKQLVIVRYSIDHHDPLLEWVYNRADIDNAKVVWLREIPGQSTRIPLEYFHERQAWLVEPDSEHPSLSLYSPRTEQNSRGE